MSKPNHPRFEELDHPELVTTAGGEIPTWSTLLGMIKGVIITNPNGDPTLPPTDGSGAGTSSTLPA